MRKKGFTLTELLICTVIFLMVWLALAGNVMIGKASEIRSRHTVQAALFAQGVVENLRQIPFASLMAMLATNPNLSNVIIGAENPATQFNALQRITIDRIRYSGTAPIYAEITVGIRWSDLSPMGRPLFDKKEK